MSKQCITPMDDDNEEDGEKTETKTALLAILLTVTTDLEMNSAELT